MDKKAILEKIDKKVAFEVKERKSLKDLGDLIAEASSLIHKKEVKLNEVLPESHFSFLASDAIALEYLQFKPKSEKVQLNLILSWQQPLSLFDGTFQVEACSVFLSFENSHWFANLSGQLLLADYLFEVSLELPSLYTRINYIHAAELPDPGSPIKLLEKFGVTTGTDEKTDADDKRPKLTEFMLLAVPPAKRFMIRVGLANLPVGPMKIGLDGKLAYQDGALTGSLWTQFELTRKGKNEKNEEVEKPLLLIALSAEHEGPGKGLQLEGGLATRGLNLIEVYESLKNKFGSNDELPAAVDDKASGKSVEIQYVFLSFNTASKAFKFSIKLDFHGFFGVEKHENGEANDEIDLTIQIAVSPYKEKGKTKYKFNFTGQLLFKLEDDDQKPLNLEFDLVFDKNGKGKTLIAAYKQLSDQSVNIGRLIHLLNDKMPELDFSVSLKEAYLIFQKKEEKSWGVILGANIGAGINLSRLPLVGDLIPDADSLKIDLQPYYANQEFKGENLKSINSLLPGDGISLPSEIKKKGPGMGITLQLGGKPLNLDIPIQLGDKVKSTSAKNKKESSPEGDPSDGKSSDGTKWFKLQKKLGPIQFDRLGIQYQKEVRRFHFKFDGALSAAGLTLTLEGLSASVVLPKDTKTKDTKTKDTKTKDTKSGFNLQPKFDLQGLGLDFKKGALEIGASFLRSKVEVTIDNEDIEVDEYSGLALIKYNTFRLSAFGSIAFIRGNLSLFIYGSLNYPIGGPSFFFVTGLAAGFGFNRKLRMPEIEDVPEFPLIKLAKNASEGKEVKQHKDRKDAIMGILQSLHQYVPPEMGAYFLAVGVRFTSFNLLDTFMLFSVSFGNSFSIDALGVSTLSAPAPVKGKKSVPPVAFVEMAIMASFRPAEGFLGVRAQLTSKSYLFSKDCHLTGGFAFYSWFDPHPNAGDFVLTLGGYHPHFKVPDHYPQVPRLGYNWQITDEILIKGEFYFALTASALMAGGHYNATYESGDIKAWFDASANFIVSWQPYFYEADFHLELGVDVTIHFLGTHHLYFNLGADMEVWGPDFSGYGKIYVGPVSFTIKFGSGLPMALPISWADFQDSFLPAPDKVGTAKIGNGLVKELKFEENKILYQVNAKEMEISFETVIPLNGKDDNDEFPLKNYSGYEMFGMGPLGTRINDKNLKSSITSFKGIDIDHFDFEPITKKMPSAIWGGKVKPGVNDPLFIEDAVVGFKMKPKKNENRSETKEVEKKKLAFETYEMNDAYSFEPAINFHENGSEDDDLQKRTNLQNQLLEEKTVNTRNQLFADLGFESYDLKGGLSENLIEELIEAPRIGKFS